ncbi:MAG: hypothetical protein R3298_05910 [Gammaproteobacteria bacterium]|nr:hypothetical protein [Gammaproteobacteria bacterium]
MRIAIPCLVALLLLGGCATPYTLVEPGPQTVRETLTVTPGRAWNRVATPGIDGKVEVWTLDGTMLNMMTFFAGVEEGEPIFVRRRLPGAKEGEKPPVFRARMTPLEIADLFRDTTSVVYGTAIVETTGLRPATLAGLDGFRFETSMVGQDEVVRSGTALGAVHDGRLYMIWFLGAKLHYFERYLPEVERVFASARVAG